MDLNIDCNGATFSGGMIRGGGQKIFSAAGANVITSLVPSDRGLAGMAQSSLDIAEAGGSTASIRLEPEKLGMRTAYAEDYRNWIVNRRKKILNNRVKERMAW